MSVFKPQACLCAEEEFFISCLSLKYIYILFIGTFAAFCLGVSFFLFEETSLLPAEMFSVDVKGFLIIKME